MDFVGDLRRNTNYPYVRGVVQFFVVIGYVAAALIACLGVLMLMKGGDSGFITAVVMWLGAVIIMGLVRLGRELTLMLADVADGVLSIAKAQADSLPPRANTDW